MTLCQKSYRNHNCIKAEDGRMTSKPGHRTYYAIAEVRISSVSKTHEKKKTKQTSSVLLTINSYRQKKRPKYDKDSLLQIYKPCK